MKIIGLVGISEAGKTTVGKHLEQQFKYKRMAFADPLKQMLIAAGICTYEEVYVTKTPESRRMMQLIGTEIFRKQIHPDFWVQRTADAIFKARKAQACSIVLDDIRFPNEAKLVRAFLGEGVLVKVERIGHVNSDAGTTHESESQIDNIECDYTIRAESGDVAKLYACIEEIIGERI